MGAQYHRCMCAAASLTGSIAAADVVEYEVKEEWVAQAQQFTTINFTGYPDHTIITTQYQHLGVLFTDGTDRIRLNNNTMPNDGAGLHGAFDTIHLAFSEPMHHVAVEFPGSMQIQLYWRGELTYTSSDFLHVGVGFFAGLISDEPFDAAILRDPMGDVFIDDLHFGPPIPAPGALAVFALAPLIRRRRRA